MNPLYTLQLRYFLTAQHSFITLSFMFEHIEIPQELLPIDGRFGCGPSLIQPEFLEQLVQEQKSYLGTSHRQSAVKNRVASIFERLRSYLKVPSGYKIAMGNGSASLVWDMMTFSLIEKQSLCFVNGEFSKKCFASAKSAQFVQATEIAAENGTLPTFVEKPEFDVHCLAWNETSTGAMYPVLPSCKNSLLAVDATSAAGAVECNLANTDLFYFSPQKAFGSEGGLWIGIFSPRAIERVEKIKKSGRYIPAMLDFSLALKNADSNQTYNTPALTTLYLLDKQLEWFLQQGGISAITKEQKEKQKILHDWIDRRPELSHYIAAPEARSLTVCTINIIPEIPYADLTKRLRKFNIIDIDCYRNLGANQIRVSLFPNISKQDILQLCKSIDYLLDHRK